MEKGVPNEGCFARKRFALPQFSSIALLCPILFFCTGLALAPVPSAAQMMVFGGSGFGIGGGGGLGPRGFFHRGGMPGFAGRYGRSAYPWGQYRVQPQWRQGSPFGVYPGAQRYYHTWRSYQQPSRGGTGESLARGICNDGLCTKPPIYHHHFYHHHWRVLVPPREIAYPNLPPRGPRQHFVNPAGPPPPQAPKPPSNAHAATPPPTKPPRVAQAAPPRPNSGVPPKDEHRYVPDEVLFELKAGVSPQAADAIARRQQLQRLASQPLELIGTTLYRYKIKDRRSVPTVIAALERDPRIGPVQPNYLYTLQDGQNGRFAGDQYAVRKMHLPEAHAISNGEKTLVAVIDSGVDSNHPEILGAISESFDAINGGKGEKAAHGTEVVGYVHGTEITGIIASHAALTGVAPQAHILAVRAFKGGGKVAVVGTTFDILAGINWAVVKHNARIVNMSFGGPPDPVTSRMLAGGAQRGVIVVAAVGNEGKAAKPLFPAADENVIAVTATDREDVVFKDASHCTTTCVAAPGVEIFAAAPNGTPAGTYKYDSGTSMAVAQVSGVIALLLDAKPDLGTKTGRDLLVKTVRDLLVKTAKHLSPANPDENSIAGIVDAYAMLEATAAPGLPEEGRSAAPRGSDGLGRGTGAWFPRVR